MRIAKAVRYPIATMLFVEIHSHLLPVAIDNRIVDDLSVEEVRKMAKWMAQYVIEDTRYSREFDRRQDYEEPPAPNHKHRWQWKDGQFVCVAPGCPRSWVPSEETPWDSLKMSPAEAATRLSRLEQERG